MSCCAADLPPPNSVNQSNAARPGAGVSGDVIALIIAGFIAGNSMVATLVTNLSEMSPQTRTNFQTGLLISTFAVAALLSPQLGRSVVANFRRRSLSVDGLFVLGCGGAMSYSLLTYVRGTGPVYFEVFSILLVIYCLGNWIKRRTQLSVWTALDAWSPKMHRCEIVDREGHTHDRMVAEVRPGDRVRVPAGALIPIDAIVMEGQAFVRESTVTGEPYLRSVRSGDEVFASSQLIDASLEVEATKQGDDRIIDRVISVVAAAQNSPSRWQSQADRIARWFTPAVALVAFITLIMWATLTDLSTAWMVALSVLLVACPCAFGFATPVSIWVTLSRLASRSLVARRADVIERLAEIDTVVFDKTGTLTVLQPELSELLLSADTTFTRHQILSAAKSIEAYSHHPIASVFLSVDAAIVVTQNIESMPAVGVRGVVSFAERDHRVEIGRLKALHRPCCDGSFLQQIDRVIQSGQQPIAIRIDEALVAVAIIQENSIDTLDEGVAKLRALGVEVKVFSGDCGSRLDRIGIADAIGAMTPETKLSEVRSLQAAGKRILFIGDGLNDAAAMSAATASISVAGGAPLATETSDLVWHGHDLRVIADALCITRRSVLRLRRTLLFAVTYNSLGMLVAATGFLHPVIAVLLMLASSLTVVLHAADMTWESEQANSILSLSTGSARSQAPSSSDAYRTPAPTLPLIQIGFTSPAPR